MELRLDLRPVRGRRRPAPAGGRGRAPGPGPDPAAAAVPQPDVRADLGRLRLRRHRDVRRDDLHAAVPADRQGDEPHGVRPDDAAARDRHARHLHRLRADGHPDRPLQDLPGGRARLRRPRDVPAVAAARRLPGAAHRRGPRRRRRRDGPDDADPHPGRAERRPAPGPGLGDVRRLVLPRAGRRDRGGRVRRDPQQPGRHRDTPPARAAGVRAAQRRRLPGRPEEIARCRCRPGHRPGVVHQRAGDRLPRGHPIAVLGSWRSSSLRELPLRGGAGRGKGPGGAGEAPVENVPGGAL